ncbi:VTT domain-containing protein [Paraburkholderia sp. GAS42]|jgi:membrane protein DedA with SNARE-associated domain/membrane-associated phospholipid phosphatase|uniref:VTT domain-containing protein n=1 Tax=Paraburkholderia sp. GAS42 TaxID=3035135 RepID=UPI003D233338
MEHAYFQLLHFLTANPSWALAVVVLAAFFEAIAVIGTFVPGSTAMFIAGALVGTGSLNLGWVMACAIGGAIAGDAASYWFGARHKTTIMRLWPFRSHPGLLKAGKTYFEKHGAKSVIFARFIAPVRAIVPVVAGMMGMSRLRFFAVNVLSALLWAPAHILPGVVFGASMELAGAVSFRLVIVVAIFVAIGWMTVKLIGVIVSHARNWTDVSRQRLLYWAKHNPHAIGRIVLRTLDPDNPATGLIVGISLLLLVSGAVFISTLNDVASGNPLVQVDMSVYRFLRSFHASLYDKAIFALSTFGSTLTLSILALFAVIWMAVERRWRTVLYWLIAVVFSQVLILAIQIAASGLSTASVTSSVRAFPSNHVAGAVVIYGFLAFLLARRVGLLSQILVATTTTAILVAVALSGLYSGLFSFSAALGGAALAAIWVFLVALTAVWRHPSNPPPRPLMPLVVLLLIGLAVGAQLDAVQRSAWMNAAKPPAPIVITPVQWTDRVWRTFSCYRSSMEGDRREPITVQWTATADQVRTQLLSRGWVEGTPLSARSVLSLVSPDVTAVDLPALPKLNNGEPSTLVFIRADAAADQRDVLRFWTTDYAVEHQRGGAPTPIWLGSVVHERLRRPTWPFNVLRPDLRIQPMILDQSSASAWRDLQIARSTGCLGVPVTLIASRAG